jgi:UDP-glucose 4-epimerase
MNVTYSVEQPQIDASINVLGSLNVLEQCARSNVQKIIYASSAGAVYGEPVELPVTEKAVAKPISHYGASKLAVEHYLNVYNRIYGLAYTILRYGNVYGPRQLRHGEAGVVPILLDALRQRVRPALYGNGDPIRDYIFVGDVARANMAALNKGQNDCFNISTGKGTSVRDLYQHLMRLTRVEVEPVLGPLRSGEVLSIVTSPAKADSGLKWRAEVELEEGLLTTIRWFDGEVAES